MRFALILAVFSFSAPALADDDLTPDKAAKIEREKAKAFEAVDKKYGNKKPSELSNDERGEVIKDRAAAEREVFEKNEISGKAYTQYTMKMSQADRAATKAADAKLEEKEKAAASKEKEKEKEKAAGPKEIPIQRGFNDNNPVVLEEKPGAAPVVEKGLPKDYADDQTAAGMTDSTTQPAPTKAAGKGKGKKK